jgi:adenine-specific DNA-methyltransferase
VPAKSRRTSKQKTPVEYLKHAEKRANIPTEELRDFVTDQENRPDSVLYPRDSSLDPQLVWKGKDEQDQIDLGVQVVPIYIQEKIHPQALIEDLRSHFGTGEQAEPNDGAGFQSNLFGDFNGVGDDFARKLDFYSHDSDSQPRWSNRMILGDSLFVMSSLSEKERLRGQVQTIYFDPPYGITFGSNWQVSTRKPIVKDKPEDATRQPEQVRAFRDTWKRGIHSYLTYVRDRLSVARELLTETGSIFFQIGDENLHLVRCLLDEVFGSENFIANIAFKKKKMPLGETYIFTTSDYLIWYGKDAKQTKFRKLFIERNRLDSGDYGLVELPTGEVVSRSEERARQLTNGSRLLQSMDLRSSGRTESCVFAFDFAGKQFYPSEGRSWKTNIEGMKKLALANRLLFSADTLRYKLYYDDYPVQELSHMWMDTQGATDKDYVVQTSVKVIERCLLMTTDPGDLVLDPTCGSGTTAYVAEQWGRRWITIDTSRVALALARTRLMSAKYPYFLLADSPEGLRKEAAVTARIPAEHPTESDIKKGFVYKRVPHVTLGSIANNPEIKKGMTPDAIDNAIARNANSELLYDQPYEDSTRIRVAGPFSVDSLSPHRVLAADQNMDGTVSEQEAQRQQDFASMILDNLKKAGVQNTRKQERLVFEAIEPFAGQWINAVGTYTDSDAKLKRAAISIGPEHGTVGPQQVKEAAKEAVQGIGFDLLVVCGFAFDPHVAEESKRYGKLTVLPTRMNPDLAMGDELLKKTGAGNLFMVFGEPDVDIRGSEDGKITAEIKGLDIYDPTTGEIRSSSTDDLACWFIDTDYNGESFFVRHAYFLGADEPYEKLKRALRAEVDENAWSSLYSTTSRPFKHPTTGKIAIKVINHYGDEVLKVFEVV